ncbi:MAG: TolC family protein [Candidatus Marinimicrobia bacterium]|nr:TolC family protein [Candidatus Neomarinimicrobiota bacterium]
MKNFIFMALLIGCGISKEFSIIELTSIAFDHNSEIFAYTESVIASKHYKNTVGTLPNPRLSGGYFINPVVTKEGPQEWKIGLNQSIPFIGKLSLQRKIATHQITQAEISLIKSKLQIQTKVWNLYEKIKKNRDELEIVQQSLDLSKHLEAVIFSKYKTSTIGHPNLVQIQLRIIKLENRLSDMNDVFHVLWQELEFVIGKQIQGSLQESDNMKENNIGINLNADFLLNKEKVKIADKQVKLSKLEYIPDFTIGMDYIKLDNIESDKNPLIMKMGISLPIWPYKNNNIIKSKKSNYKASEYKLKDIQNKLEAKLIIIQNEINEYNNDINMYQTQLIPKAIEGFETAESAYISGNLSFSDLIASLQLLIELQFEAVNVDFNNQIAVAQYYELTGQLITNLKNEGNNE